jgi:5'-nucleotidase
MRTPVLLLSVLVACKAPPKAAVDDAPVTLTVLSMNDFHGALYETSVPGDKESGLAIGGLPWLHAAVQAHRADDPELLLLDGGDEFQGSWPVNATKGRGSVEALTLLGVDASALGNHEFDYGGIEGGHPLRGALERAAAAAPYPLLSANVYNDDGSRYAPEGIAPFTVLERKGKRIAIIGLSTIDTPQVTVPANVEGLEFRDVVQSVRDILPEVQATEPDVTVLVGHLTGKCDTPSYLGAPAADCMPDGEIGQLLTELPPGTFDVMVLGHAHTLLQQRIGDTFVLESRAKGHVLSRLDLVVGPDGVDLDASTLHEPWALTHPPADPGCSGEAFPTEPLEVGGRTLTPSTEAVALIAALENEVGSLCTELGCVDHPMEKGRTHETELGSWMADAMRATWPEADLAIQNGGGIRSDLPAGTLRREHLQNVMPFDNRTLLVEMTGAQVRTLFRIGSSGGHGLLSVSGARYGFDPDRTEGSDLDGDGEVAAWETDRLCFVEVGGEPVDDERVYKVVTSDFLFQGGDHLGPAFEGSTKIEEGPLLRERLYEHAESTEGCVGATPVTPADTPRIVVGPCR